MITGITGSKPQRASAAAKSKSSKSKPRTVAAHASDSDDSFISYIDESGLIDNGSDVGSGDADSDIVRLAKNDSNEARQVLNDEVIFFFHILELEVLTINNSIIDTQGCGESF